MKLDRTAFKMGSHQQSSDNRDFWANQPMHQRLKAAFYLNGIAYNFDINQTRSFGFVIRKRTVADLQSAM